MLRRQCQRLVQRIRVQRLRSAQYRRQRLNGNTNNIVVRLLRCERAPRRLRVESKRRRTRILRTEALCHHPVPDFSGGTIFSDLLEEIVMRVEKERKARRKIVQLETGAAGPLDVLDAVVQGKGKLLQGGGAGFTDVIAAD